MSIVSVSTFLIPERSLSFDSWRLEGGGDPGEIREIVFGVAFGSYEFKTLTSSCSSNLIGWTLAVPLVHNLPVSFRHSACFRCRPPDSFRSSASDLSHTVCAKGSARGKVAVPHLRKSLCCNAM